MKFYTKISTVMNNGLKTGSTRVLLGKVCITFKGDTIIGVETPTESYSTERLERNDMVFRYDTRWTPNDPPKILVTPDEIIILLNRLLKEQGEEILNDRLKQVFLGGQK